MPPYKLTDEIKKLKKEKDILILAHNYQLPEIQDIADYVGDSLGLAQKAVSIRNKSIVLCGVYFMAETAAILNPNKDVFIPDENAGCPLADFATSAMIKKWRAEYPDHAFVAYVNTSAEVKALSDICCTSANAERIVRSVKNKKIVFLPDKNLGDYVKRRVPEKEVVLWPGFCVVHENADFESVLKAKEENPKALVMVHPECRIEIRDMADGILSTGQMFEFVRRHPDIKSFIVITEWGIIHALKKEFPEKDFIEPSKRMECKNMKRITLDKLLLCIREGKSKVTVEESIAIKARLAIEKMLDESIKN